MPITGKERQLIILLHKDGYTVTDISRETGLSRPTIYFWIKRYQREGHLNNHPRSGTFCALKSEKIDEILTTYKEQPDYPTKVFAKNLHVSGVTIRRRLQNIKVNIKDERADQSFSSETSATHLNSPMKKQKLSIEDTSDDDMCTSGTDDKYDALGKHIASEVRQLGEQQRMLVERIIYEVINAGRNGSLNVRSKLVVNSEVYGSEKSDDNKILSPEDGEINVEEDVVEIKVEMDEPINLIEKALVEVEDKSCSDGVGLKNDCNPNAEKFIILKEPEDISQLQQEDKDISIKVKNETEEDINLLERSDLPIAFEKILIKHEIKTEDEDLLGNLKTEFIINKQQSSIKVYSSSDAKRKRMDKVREAKIHSELQGLNVQR